MTVDEDATWQCQLQLNQGASLSLANLCHLDRRCQLGQALQGLLTMRLPLIEISCMKTCLQALCCKACLRPKLTSNLLQYHLQIPLHPGIEDMTSYRGISAIF